MMFGRIASLVMAFAAVLGVFTYIPILSDYAFWLMVGAFLIWVSVHRVEWWFGFLRLVSLVLTVVAIVGVFVEIPIVSDYAFWVVVAAYVLDFSVSR